MCTRIKNWFCNSAKQDTGMSLDNFVSMSLVQIYNGIQDAQSKITRIPIDQADEKYFAGYIVPTPVGGRKSDIYNVQFDVVVSTTNATEKTNSGNISASANIKQNIFVVGGYAGLEEGRKTNQFASATNRLQFSVPVIYPSMPIPHPGNEK